jgi:lipopolysaccharide biosynthesis glycosyltransferase
MIPIFMCFDKTLETHVDHVVDSILANTKREVQFNFIIDDGVSYILSEQWRNSGAIVHVIDPPVKSFYNGGMVRSPAMFYRWMIPQFCDDKAIYIDNDVIVIGDIGELYDIDIGDNLIAAVRDRFAITVSQTLSHQGDRFFINDSKQTGSFQYTSYMSGQLLINCELWRSIGMIKKMYDFVKQTGALDMLTLNIFCKDKVHELSREWCVSANYDDIPMDAKLLHWHGTAKPWDIKCKNQEYYERYAE